MLDVAIWIINLELACRTCLLYSAPHSRLQRGGLIGSFHKFVRSSAVVRLRRIESMNRRGTGRVRSMHAAGWVVWSVWLASIGACSPSESGPQTHAVRGQVFVNDQPAAGALIVFSPADGSGDRDRPRGYVDEDGEFTLTTFSLHDGAPAGNYKVAVIWREQQDEGDPPGRYLTAEKYSRPETSGLRAEIQAGQNELQPFFLSE